MTAILTGKSRAFVPYEDRPSWAFEGDSITVGNTSVLYGGYRFELLEEAYDYYGDVPNVRGLNYANSFSHPCIGASGITSSQLFTTYIDAQLPVLGLIESHFMCIGSNDAATGVATETYVANVIASLDKIREENPYAVVYLMNCPDRTGFTSTVNAYNAALEAAVFARDDYHDELIVYIDINTLLGSATGANFGDGIHPNRTLGYPIMAQECWARYKAKNNIIE